MRQRIWVVGIAAVLILTGCAAEQPVDELDVAMNRCVGAHSEQTAEQSCERWLDEVGEEAFIDQWTEEYAELYRRAFPSD